MKEIEPGGFPNADAVCKILEACALHGVAELKMPGLEASFFVTLGKTHQISGAGPTIPPLDAEQTIQAQERVEKDSHEEQEIAVREEQIAELLITDPLAAEQLLEEGALMEDEGANGGYDDE